MHEKLNSSKGVIRIRKLFLATSEEITKSLGKQGFTDYMWKIWPQRRTPQTKQRSHRSLICPQKAIKDRLKNCLLKLLKNKSEADFNLSRKTHINIKLYNENPGSIH